jgi:predicted phosphodiesterase
VTTARPTRRIDVNEVNVKLRLYSDLHIEFHPFVPPTVEADVVVLAGDIHTRARGVAWAAEAFDVPLIYCCGNHEFYSGHLENTLTRMQAHSASYSHVHVMENQALVMGEVRFLVATGWTDYSAMGNQLQATYAAWGCMNDFKQIRTQEYRRLRPYDLIQKNRQSFEWLDQQLSVPFDGLTVVVTHHAPLVSVLPEYLGRELGPAYANDWAMLLERANVWLFGHTHKAVDFMAHGCRVVSNPRGYPGEKTGFDPCLILDI